MRNPFPGMNPWLEEYWRDVHTSLLVDAREQLNRCLPPGMRARVEARLAIELEHADQPRSDVADVAITEPWDRPAGPVLGLESAATLVAEPEIVDVGEETVRHLEIVDSREHVITAIDLLSPRYGLNTSAPRTSGRGVSDRKRCRHRSARHDVPDRCGGAGRQASRSV